MKKSATFVAAGLLSGLVAFTALADYGWGVTLIPGCLAAVLVLGAVIVASSWKLSRSRSVLLAGSAFVAAVVVLRFAALSPVKPFQSFFRELRPGMSQQAVLERLDQVFPEGGSHAKPTVVVSKPGGPERISLTLDPSSGEYDSEIIVVNFAEGRLVDAEYFPD